MNVISKSTLTKVGASAELPALLQVSLRLLVSAHKLHWLQYASNISRHCCWQTSRGKSSSKSNGDSGTDMPHSSAKKFRSSDWVHWSPGLLLDLTFRLCSVLGVSWSAEKVTLCWQWPQWISNVVKTTMITAAFIVLSTPKNTTQSVGINWPQLRGLLNKCHLICLTYKPSTFFVFVFLFLNIFTF